MSTKWIVQKGDRQVGADGMAELQRMKSEGQLYRYDLVKPPGTNEWLYANELPDMSDLPLDPDVMFAAGRGKTNTPLIALFLLIIAGGLYSINHYRSLIPEASGMRLR